MIPLLVPKGYGPNKPSACKGGRTPLAELCATAALRTQSLSDETFEKDSINYHH